MNGKEIAEAEGYTQQTGWFNPDASELRDEPTEADHDEKEPVNRVHFVSIKQFHIKQCVICGEEHYHGSMDPVVANGGRSHRVEHCHGVNHKGGYYLQLADDANPPDRWYDWVDSQTEQTVDRGGDQ